MAGDSMARTQTIVAVTKSDEDKQLISDAMVGIDSVQLNIFDNPFTLLESSIYKQSDVFLVSVNLGDYDGRRLYLEQKNRLRIIPFLFIADRPITDEDWDYLSVTYQKDLFDYLEKPLSIKKLKHRINLMLSITHIYNIHTISTIDGLRDFWKESVIRDREMLTKMREMYRKEK